MEDKEFSQLMYEAISTDTNYDLTRPDAIERRKEAEKELGISLFKEGHKIIFIDDLTDEQYKLLTMVIKHRKVGNAPCEPLPAYHMYVDKLEKGKTVEIDNFYDCVLREVEKGKPIPSHVLKSLLKAMGRPKYTDKREQLLLVLYFIEAEQINRGGSYRSAVIRYWKDLQDREPENYYESTLKIMDETAAYNKIVKEKSRLYK